MINPLLCPTPVCSGEVEVTDDWQDNDYCEFVEAKCPQCHQPYWFIRRDGLETLRDRDEDDSSFDQRNSEIR